MKFLTTRKPWESTNGLQDPSKGKPEVKNWNRLTGSCKLSTSPAPGLQTEQAGQKYPKSKDCRSIPKSEHTGLPLFQASLSENMSCSNFRELRDNLI